MNIGYIGLGALGGALAQRFVLRHALTVYDLNPAAVAALVKLGATAAASPADLARNCDTIVLCLPRSADVRQAIFGPGGLAEGLAPGKLVIDQTSGVPAETRAMADELAQRGVAMIEAAVSASPALAAQGGARLMVAGPDAAIARALPVLEAISPTIFRCGMRVGDGQAMKTVNNAMNAGCRLGTLEAVAVGRKAGMTLPAMTDALNKGTARNLTTVNMLPALHEGKSSTDFALSLMLKDLDQAIALGMGLGVPMPVTGEVRGLLQIGVNTLGPAARLEDVVGLIESMAGTKIARPGEPAPSLPAAQPPKKKPVLGYVGVGAMGAPIARRFLPDYEVHVYDVSSERTRPLVADGAIAETDLASLARACDVILTCVPTPADFREVALGSGGLLAGLAPGKIIIDQTTGIPGETRAFAAALKERGVGLVDAPISGAPQGAVAGTLTVYCGGESATIAAVRPILERIGPTVVYCGEIGNGHTAKLLNNAVAAMARLLTYECVTAGFKYGLTLENMDEVLNVSSGWSAAAKRVFELLRTGKTASAPLWLSVKDFRLTARLASDCGAPMLIINAARAVQEMALNDLGAQPGTHQLPSLYERMAKTDFRMPRD